MADIRQTAAAKHFERFLDGICAGNNGDAKIEKLELNGTSISYRAELRHKQVWDSPFGRITTYSLTNHIEGEFDIKNPSTWQGQKVCVSSPIGELCITLDELVSVLTVLLA